MLIIIPVLGNFPILGYTETHKGLKTPYEFLGNRNI